MVTPFCERKNWAQCTYDDNRKSCGSGCGPDSDAPPNNTLSWSMAAQLNWEKVANAVHGQMNINNVLPSPVDFIIPQDRDLRKDIAERLMSSLTNVYTVMLCRCCHMGFGQLNDTFVCWLVGHQICCWCSDRARTLATKRNVSSLQGLSQHLSCQKKAKNIRLLTDHLNTVRLVDDSRTGINQVPRLRYMNGWFYYR